MRLDRLDSGLGTCLLERTTFLEPYMFDAGIIEYAEPLGQSTRARTALGRLKLWCEEKQVAVLPKSKLSTAAGWERQVLVR